MVPFGICYRTGGLTGLLVTVNSSMRFKFVEDSAPPFNGRAFNPFRPHSRSSLYSLICNFAGNLFTLLIRQTVAELSV